MSERPKCPRCGFDLARPEARGQRECPICGTQLEWPGAGAAEPKKPSREHPLLLFASRKTEHHDLIDMTAMVDIVFFLLIFFLVTSMQSLEAVIGLPKPQGPSVAATAPKAEELEDDPNFVTVTIYEDDSVWIENDETYGDQDLRVKLRALRKTNPAITGMFVIGAADANHGAFVGLLDAAADAGFSDLKFSIQQDEEPADLAGS